MKFEGHGDPVTARQDDDAVVHIAAVAIPFSNLASPEEKQNRIRHLQEPKLPPGLDIVEMRRLVDKLWMIPHLERMRRTFDVTIEERIVGGIVTDVVEPAGGVPEANRHRVLINLHGGGFVAAARYSGQQESTSIAALGGFRVITVDYRMGPENQHPAASEDVEAVYRELLNEYPAENIGIYGCSAGGGLTAQVTAWLRHRGLPRPGGIGIFGMGALIDRHGDSGYFGNLLTGSPPAAQDVLTGPDGYHIHADPRGPLVSPAYHDDVLRDFPPTLLISGTRDWVLSGVLYTHSRLVANGADARLHVWEGQEHCSFAQGPAPNPDVPEHREIWDVIVKFFDGVLGRRRHPCL